MLETIGRLNWSIAVAALQIAVLGSSGAPVASAAIDGCEVLPTNNIWNARVDALPIDASSAAYVASIGGTSPLRPFFGTEFQGVPIGIPYVSVPGTQTPVDISFLYSDESDPGPYPIPPDAPIEGGPDAGGDRHVLVLDRDACVLYELFGAYPVSGGASWNAVSGAIFDLASNDLRPEGWISTDAAGLPVLPGLVRYDEVAGGEIRHALRFSAPQTRRSYVWPARHFASPSDDPNLPPMGQRFRLRSDFDLSGFSPSVQVILIALKRYGMLLADNGTAWSVSGVPDSRWDDLVLQELLAVQGSDFEAVDASSLQVDPDSGEARPPAPVPAIYGPGLLLLVAVLVTFAVVFTTTKRPHSAQDH